MEQPERVTELEIRLTHQQRTIDELNLIVTEQQALLVRLERELKTVREQLSLVLPSMTRTPEEEEPPPHY